MPTVNLCTIKNKKESFHFEFFRRKRRIFLTFKKKYAKFIYSYPHEYLVGQAP